MSSEVSPEVSSTHDPSSGRAADPDRLRALARYDILDTPPSETFDRISDLAAGLFDAPIGLITFVEPGRQWHKACVGFDAPELDLDASFCVHTLGDAQRLVVEDATDDERFVDNPLVTGDRHVRFYAGSPMTTPDGHVLGTVCVMDTEPRSPTEQKLERLEHLSQMAVDRLEERRQRFDAGGRIGDTESTETQLNELLASVDDVVWEVRIHPSASGAADARRQELLYTNSSEEHIFGRPTDALIRDPMLWRSAAHPQDQESLPTTDALLQRGGWRGEYRLLQPDGTTRWVETSLRVVGRPSVSSSGDFSSDEAALDAPVKLVGITRSVHRRRQAEASMRKKSAALAEETARLRMALDAADAGVFEWSVPEDRRVWDERVQGLFGLDAAPSTTGELLGHIHPDDRDHFQDEMARVLGSPEEEAFQVRYRLRRPDGDLRHVQARALVQRDEAGKAERLIGIYQDVTERQERRQELRRSERQFKAVFQDPDLLIGLLDPDGTLRRVNPTALTYIDGEQADVVGRLLWKTPWWNHDSALQADLQKWIDRAADGEYVTYQAEHVTGDGLTVTVRGSIRPVTDEDGTVTALIVSGRDVTTREDQRRELEVLHQAVEDSVEGIAVLADEEYVYVDQTHADMYGFDDKEQLLGNTWRMLYGEEEIERLETTVFPILEEEGHWQGSVTGQRPDGSTFPAELSLTITEAGRLVCTVRDMTDRREQNRKRQLLLTASETGIAEWDPHADQIQWDGMLRGTFGRAPANADDFFALIHPDDRSRVRARIESAIDDMSSWNGEYRIEDGDGRPRWVETLVIPIFENGKVARLLATITDVTERKEREQELRVKERAMDEADVGIQITDPTRPHNPLVYVNEGFETQTGYDRDDVLGEGDWLLQGPDTDPETAETLRAAVDAGNAATAEIKSYRHDGTPYWCRLSLTPIRDEEGALQHYVGIRQDITERRRKTKLLEERQRKLDLALAETDTGLLEWDVQTGEMHWDETLQALFGHNPKTFEAFTEIVHPNDLSRVEAAHQDMIEAGESWAGEFWVLHPDDGIARMKVRATPVYEGGEAVRVLGIATDVTAQWERRRDLSDSRERYQKLLEASPDPVLVADAGTGKIIETNAAAVDLLGRPREEIVGAHHTDLHPPDRSEAYVSLFRQCHDADGLVRALPDGTQIEVVTGDGDAIPVEINPTTVDLPGGRMVYAVFRDVSDWKTMQDHLTRRERRFRMMFEEHSAPMLLIDEETGAIEKANTAAVDFYGYDRAALTSMSIQDINQLPQEEVAQKRRAAAADGGEFLFEHELASGETRTVQVLSAPIPDLERSGTLLFSVIHDVTEREEQRRALADQKVFLDQILNTIDDVFFLLNRRGDLLLWNDRVNEVTGYTDAELETMTAFDFFGDDDAAHVRDAVEALTPGGPVRVEASVVTKDGRRVPHQFVGDSFHDPERGWVLCGTGRDITEQKARRQALQRANRRFEQFAETVPDAFFIVAPEYSELFYANRAVETLYGVDRDTLRDDPSAWTRHVHPADLPSLRASIEAQDTDEASWPQHQEFRVQHPTRGRRWLLVRIDSIDTDDASRKLAGVATDVTERKVRERRLRALHHATRDLLDVSTEAAAATVVTDTLGDTLGLAQAAVYLRDGDTLQRVSASVGEKMDAVPRVEQGHTPLWTALTTGETQVYSDPSEIDDSVDRSSIEACAYVPLGEHGALVVGTTAPNRLDDDERRLVEVVARSLRDTLDALDRERDLIVRERRYRTLAENIPNGGVLLFDEDFTYMLAAGELIGMYELEESDFVGEQVGTVFVGSEGDRHPIVDHYEAALEGERTERRIEVGDHTLRVHIVPLRGESEAKGLVLGQDVTKNVRREHKLVEAKEAAETANEMKSALLANMSHEIRTPLTSILGFAEVIGKEADPEGTIARFAGLIEKGGQRLMDTLDSVLNLSKLEGKAQSLVEEPVNLSAEVQSTVDELQPAAEAKNITLDAETGGDAVWARADAEGVQLVARNLVKNAIKYTEDGGTVEVRVRDDDDAMVLEVEDNGIGIDEEALAYIFEPFRQESEGLGREYEGVGLGLAVVKQATEDMDGRIEVESEKEEGATFSVRLPRAENEPPTDEQPNASATGQA